MNGAAGVVGENPPTPEQWANMREKLGEAVGGIVARKLLEEAEEVQRQRDRLIKEMEYKQKEVEAMQQAYVAKMANARPHIAQHTGLHTLHIGASGSGGGSGTLGYNYTDPVDPQETLLEKTTSPSLLGRLMSGISVKASTS
jgi:hypothetical protein